MFSNLIELEGLGSVLGDSRAFFATLVTWFVLQVPVVLEVVSGDDNAGEMGMTCKVNILEKGDTRRTVDDKRANIVDAILAYTTTTSVLSASE